MIRFFIYGFASELATLMGFVDAHANGVWVVYRAHVRLTQ